MEVLRADCNVHSHDVRNAEYSGFTIRIRWIPSHDQGIAPRLSATLGHGTLLGNAGMGTSCSKTPQAFGTQNLGLASQGQYVRRGMAGSRFHASAGSAVVLLTEPVQRPRYPFVEPARHRILS